MYFVIHVFASVIKGELRSTIVCALSITYLSSVPCPIPVLLVTAMLMIQIETMLSQPERDKGKTERDNRGN